MGERGNGSGVCVGSFPAERVMTVTSTGVTSSSSPGESEGSIGIGTTVRSASPIVYVGAGNRVEVLGDSRSAVSRKINVGCGGIEVLQRLGPCSETSRRGDSRIRDW